MTLFRLSDKFLLSLPDYDRPLKKIFVVATLNTHRRLSAPCIANWTCCLRGDAGQQGWTPHCPARELSGVDVLLARRENNSHGSQTLPFA